MTTLDGLSLAARRAMEERLLRRARERAVPAGPTRGAGGTRAPLSLAQRRLWFFHQLRPDLPLYQSSGCFRLDGELDVAALRAAVTAVTARHAILRTRVELDADGEAWQIIDEAVAVDVPLTDLTCRSEGDRAAEELAVTTISAPFDLARDWPMRVRLIRVAPDRHVFVIVIHHMFSDGWSLRLLFRDLAQAYAAADERVDLPDLPVQYADFAAWQVAEAGTPRWRDQLRYWRDRLGDAPPVLALPLDRPRAAQQSFAGGIVEVAVPGQVHKAAQALCQRVGATPFMLYLAAFQVLLHRYSGDATVVTGTPVTGRQHPQVADLIGFFVNTLALRLDFDDDPDFTALLGQVRRTVLDAFDRQDVPFDAVIEILNQGGARGLSHNPVFQNMFQFNPGDRHDLVLPGIATTRLWLGKGTSQFDLSVYLNESGDGVQGWLEYSADLFDATTAARMAEHFAVLVAALVAAPRTPVSRVAFVPAAERERIAATSRGPTRPDTGLPVLDHIARFAATSGDTVAVECATGSLTYAQLVARSRQLGAYLRARGTGPEQVVAVMVPPSVEMIVAVLGVLEAGAAYLPVDQAYPQPWIEHVLEDSGAGLVLTIGGTPPRSLPTVDLRARAAEIAAYPADGLGTPPAPRSLAYLIYTGGSTGRPKGVMIEHRSLAGFVAHGVGPLDLSPADRYLQFASLSFDMSVEEIFGALTHGATLVLRDESFDLTPELFVARCAELGLTYLPLPTAYFHSLVDAGATAALTAIPSLRMVAVGGEALSADRLNRWRREARPGVRLMNGYGPTECTVTTSWADLTAYSGMRHVPIGSPSPNLGMHVLDEAGQPVGIGVVGELFINGGCLARGYHRRPDLTAAAFLPDSLPGGAPGGRIYRTGDRARLSPDGTIVLVGRVDHQIKVRGFRIEPGDIEATLRAHEEVADALVRLRADAGGEERLTAYVVPADSTGAGPGLVDRLCRHLVDRLPRHMVPSALLVLEELPRTPAGKLDSSRLPVPTATAVTRRKPVPPRTRREARLLQIWCDLLRVDELGVHHDFFEHGGHSLLAIKLVARIRAEFGHTVALSSLFPTATVASVAALLTGDELPDDPVVVLRRGADAGSVVLAHPVGGEVAAYLPLARALPGQVGVHAVRAPALTGGPTYADLGTMASAYLDLLHAAGANVGTDTVYAGWSMGGLLALELARATGGTPSVVAIDSSWESGSGSSDDIPAAFVRDVGRSLRVDTSTVPRQGDDLLPELLRVLRAASSVPDDADVDWLARRLATFRAHAHALWHYRPLPYPGPVTLFLDASRADFAQVVRAWRGVASRLTVHAVPADHYDIVAPEHVAALIAGWPDGDGGR